MKKKSLYILPVLFIGFLLFLLTNQIFQWKVYSSSTENRKLANFPTIYYRHLDQFPKQFDEYLQDNFTFRAPFLNTYHDMMYALSISPQENDVIIGKSGQLYLAQKDKNLYVGKKFFNRQELSQLMDIWKEKIDYLEERNISWYWLIPPMKLNVFPEDIPQNIIQAKTNRTLTIKESWASHFPETRFIYPLNAIKKGKMDSYLWQDSHWSEKGAFIAYQELMKSMTRHDSLKLLKAEDIQWLKIENNDKNLIGFLGIEDKVKDSIYTANFINSRVKESEKFGFPPTQGFPYPEEYEHYYTNSFPLNNKKILVFTDSFFKGITPFINETFSESLFIFNNWTYAIDDKIVNTYKPDVVLFISMESLIQNILENPQIIR